MCNAQSISPLRINQYLIICIASFQFCSTLTLPDNDINHIQITHAPYSYILFCLFPEGHLAIIAR